MSPSRRSLLTGGSALLSAGLVSGCIGLSRWSQPAGGYVTLQNRDDVAHSIAVELVDDETGEVELENSYEVEADEEVQAEDGFGGGAYDATVTLDGEETNTHHLTIGRCSNIGFSVVVTETGSLQLSQGYCD